LLRDWSIFLWRGAVAIISTMRVAVPVIVVPCLNILPVLGM
jgi:hypothetical protein